MNKFLIAGVTTVVCATTILAGTSTAGADTAAAGQVTVFSTEFTELNVWENPSECSILRVGAHVLINQTDKPVQVYADPLCLTPGHTVRPGFGSHVTPGTGSFAVAD